MFLGVSSVVGPHGVGASPGDKKSKNKSIRGKKKSVFETYMSKEDVSEGLKRGTLIQVLKTYWAAIPWLCGIRSNPWLIKLFILHCVLEGHGSRAGPGLPTSYTHSAVWGAKHHKTEQVL